MPDTAYTEQDLRDAEKRRVAAIKSAAIPTAKATKTRNEIVYALLDDGWTMQRVANVLGVSKGYVNKLTKSRPAETTKGQP